MKKRKLLKFSFRAVWLELQLKVIQFRLECITEEIERLQAKRRGLRRKTQETAATIIRAREHKEWWELREI